MGINRSRLSRMVNPATGRTPYPAVDPVRQETQFSCMATSMMMCLRAHGIECTEKEVVKVMGAKPMEGASWDDAIVCAQHYGCRVTLVCPSSINQLREWTAAGTPVMIGWNPEGRPWSHASVVLEVRVNETVIVADPNMPDPDQTVRAVPKGEFYKIWVDGDDSQTIVRRPAMAVTREIEDGFHVEP